MQELKVGDWIRVPLLDHIFQFTSTFIEDDIEYILDGYDDILGQQGWPIDEIEPWEPQPEEWCWVYNVTREIPYLRKVIRVEANYKNRFNDYKFTKAVRVNRGDTSGEVGYRFCEPFIGELPSNLKDL